MRTTSTSRFQHHSIATYINEQTVHVSMIATAHRSGFPGRRVRSSRVLGSSLIGSAGC